jgi:hypothetical protein
MNESIFMKSVMDYPYMDNIIGLDAVFECYDAGDDCLIFAIVLDVEEFKENISLLATLESENKAQIAEISFYGFKDTYFRENKVSDLITDYYHTVVITQRSFLYNDNNTYVYNPDMI